VGKETEEDLEGGKGLRKKGSRIGLASSLSERFELKGQGSSGRPIKERTNIGFRQHLPHQRTLTYAAAPVEDD
jgi:hypothetical protein